MKQFFVIVILTLILGFLFVQFLYRDQFDLVETVKSVLRKHEPARPLRKHSVRIVRDTPAPNYVHNSRVGLWRSDPARQQRMVLQYRIGGKQHDQVQFVKATQIEFDSRGRLYVLDRGYKSIEVFDPKGQHLRTLGIGKRRSRLMADPSDMALSSHGDIFIADRRKGILILRPDGSLKRVFRTPYVIEQIVLDSRGSLIALTPQHQYLLHKFDTYGKELMAFAEQEESSEVLRKVFGQAALAIDSEDNVYVSYVYPYRIVKYSSKGTPVLLFDRELEIAVTPPTIERGEKGAVKRVVRQMISYDLRVGPDRLIYNLVRLKGAIGGDVLDVFSSSGQYLLSFYLGTNAVSFALFQDEVALLSPHRFQRIEKYRFESF